MANDELMRLAAEYDGLAGAADMSGKTAERNAWRRAASDLRALAQRAPQNGAVPEGWRDGVQKACNRIKRLALECPLDSGIRDDAIEWAGELDALLAAAPAPVHSADAAGSARPIEEVMSSDPGRPAEDDAVDRGEVVEPSPRYAPPPEAETLDESLKRTIREISDEITPEAERAEDEAVASLDDKMRARGFPPVKEALAYSRNYAESTPYLTQTGKDHILGLCSMLEIAAANPAPPPAGQPEGDDIAVDRFAEAMKAKMAAARAKGRGGWEGPTCNAEILSRMLRDHVEKGDPRDVANFCMMLWNRGEAIQANPTPAADAGGVTVTDEAVNRAYQAFHSGRHANTFEAWRAALTAALTPEARHGE